jgi:prepilin-type N-terminal cleavage/methylation domain-containing protein
MRSRKQPSSAFTLIELVLVMVIVAILVGVIAPSLRGFMLGRNTVNTATQIMALAGYARTEAISEGRTYRLNFDQQSGKFWLTDDHGDGTYQAPTSEEGREFQVPTGVKMEVAVNAQAVTEPNLPLNVQETAFTGPPPISGSSAGPTNQLMQVTHESGQDYVEFQPTGRSDEARIQLTDQEGKSTVVSCDSATELFHILPAGAERTR